MSNTTRWLRFSLAAFSAALLLFPALSHAQKKPNILVIFGDDVGQTNLSAYSFGLVGYKTPNIDRIAKEGMMHRSNAWMRCVGRNRFRSHDLEIETVSTCDTPSPTCRT